MVHEFDVKTFLQNIKATKPPYQCPFEGCGKPYKTYIGMRFHIYNYDHVNNTGIISPDGDRSNRKRGQWHHRQTMGRSPSPPDFLRTSNREALTYAEAQKMVEFDVDGKIYRINISEPLNIVHVDGKNGDTPINGINCDSNAKKLSSDASLTSNNVSSITDKTPAKGKEGRATKPGKSSKSRQQPISKTPQLPQSSLTLKLPEPSFRLIEDYEPPDAPPKVSSYHRYIEKSVEDIDEEIEYDMDEEDTAWLDLVNKMRKDKKLPEIPADIFELLMDRLEKESYFQSQNSGKDVGPAIDEDAVCCICNDGECQNSNAILFCDMCNLAVHQECYGVPYIPEGQWLCRRCLQSPSRAVDCVLCPNKGGAFKQTDDNRWSHVVCALWIPEVCFANTVFLEPIDSIDNIPQARWKLSCYVCKQRGVGACIQCHKANCYVAFHVTCAQQAGLYMKMEAVKEMTSSGLVTNVRKAAYCDAHTPADENGTTLNNVYSSGEEDSRTEQKRVQQTKAKFKEKMKKARKILAEKRSALPIVSIPTIPIERLTKIASMISIPKRNLFLQRLLGYWTLKRQSRNGVPLLRRLQISHNGLKKESHKDGDDEHVVKLKEQLKCLNRLRQDLERARLLVELIRKREKLKRELLRMHQNTVELQLNPYKVFLLDLVSRLEEKDINSFFTEPVNTDEVKDYLQFIKNPMDFSTLRSNVINSKYLTYEAFEADFELIIKNCIFYNEKDTVYHKAAIKLREQSANILKDARKKFELYNTNTGLHSPPSLHDIKVGQTLSTVTENQRLESKLKELEHALTKAKQTRSGGSRTKRVRSLTAEITDIKRQIKLNASRVNSEQSSSLTHTYQAISSSANTNINANIRSVENKSPIKPKPKRKSTKIRNSIANSDTDNTDICENLALNHHNIDSNEVRKTVNSAPNSITLAIDSVINSANVYKSNSIANRESPKRSKLKTPRIEKTVNKQEIVENGSDTNKTATHSRTNNRKRKITDTSLDSISPKSIVSTSSVLNLASFSLDKTLRNKTLDRNKTVDASTCTPSRMFTETAESYAKELSSRGQSGQTSGQKRRSNRNSSRASKRQQTSNSATNLIDTSIPFPAIMPQTESFSVYRNFNSPADSDVNSETSQSQSSTVSSKSSGSTTSHTNSSASLGSSGTSSRVSVNGLQNNKRKSNERPRSRSSRSDISIENQRIPLQPNDVVWAKCSGYPWYPALIVNPDTTELSSNGSIIPVPPKDVLALRQTHENTTQLYLVSFFDTKRSWQWLPRNKLEPLGIDNIDNVKLAESKKANERKAVQKAFKNAIEFAVLLKKNMCDQSSNGE